MMQHHHHHPCNRFGFGLNPHQVNYQMQHHTNYHQNHASNYSNGSGMIHSHHVHPTHHQHKPTNPWPTVPVSMPVNVSLPHQHQFVNNTLPRHNSDANGIVPPVQAVRDLPLTPPADREASSVPMVSSSPSSYYTMLHGSTMTAGNNNLMSNYSSTQSPIDKSMTPPQDINHHQHQVQQQAEPMNASLGWWSPASSTVSTSVPSTGQCSTTDYTFHHHHQMLAHHSTIQPAAAAAVAPPADTSRTPCSSNSGANPSEFQQRVAAALLKTHATLASRRCRRCRCPNCQVHFKLHFDNIP